MVITETRLQNIANGYLSPDKLDKPFIITRVHNTLSKNKEGCWIYSFIWGRSYNRNNDIDESIDIEPNLAKKLIKIYNMSVVHECKSGQIYEKPGTPFKKNFIS